MYYQKCACQTFWLLLLCPSHVSCRRGLRSKIQDGKEINKGRPQNNPIVKFAARRVLVGAMVNGDHKRMDCCRLQRSNFKPVIKTSTVCKAPDDLRRFRTACAAIQ